MKYILGFLMLVIGSVSEAQINQPKEIQTSQKFGGYTVHYNVFNSKDIPASIAANYQLARGKDFALINISLTKTQNGQTSLGLPAAITLKAINLMQQVKVIELKEIKEPEATYYMAALRHTNEEDLRFELSVLPEGESKPLQLSFTRRLYTEQ
jgi:uncharacterized membrane protein